jgi:LysM repeat protein
MNPSIDSECRNLLAGVDYCVAPVDGTTVPSLTSTLQPTQPPSTSSTATPTAVPPPAPTSPGTTSTCYKWYTTVSGDTCDKITTSSSITFAQFRAWNPYIDSTCSNLWADTAYCVAGASATTTSSSSAAATVSPPAPTNDGANSACAKWHTVVSGDTCDAIDARYGITFAQFRTWNPHVDGTCSNIWAGYAYCVGVP